jgi:AraC-like DNA-binding protein
MGFSRYKGAFYRKSLITILLITCIPIALMGVTLYTIGTGRIVKELNGSHQKQVNQSIQRLDDYMSQLELFVARLSMEPSFNSSLEDTNFIHQFDKTKEIDRFLTLMRDTNPLIQEVALYIEKSDTFLSNDAGYRQIRNEAESAAFRELLRQDKDIAWNNAVPFPARYQSGHAVIVKLKSSIYDTKAYGAFIVYINQKFINDYLSQVTVEDALTLLMEKGGPLVSLSYNSSRGPLNEAMLEQIKALSLENTVSTMKYHNEQYSVSHGSLSRFGKNWSYLSAAPLSAIMKPVQFISTLILLVSAAGIVSALILSWFASERIYKPFRQVLGLFQKEFDSEGTDEAVYIEKQWVKQLKQQQALEAKVKQSIPSMRESFLMQLLQGHLYYFNEEEIMAKLHLLDWDLDNHRFSFLAFQLSGAFDKVSFSNKDEQLITFAQYNVVQEICSTRFDKHFVINYQNLSVGVMIAFSWDMADEEIQSGLRELAEQIVSSLAAVLKRRVTAIIGKTADSVMEAPDCLEEARNALQYRDLNESNQILLLDELNPKEGRTIAYPFEIEKGIIHALRSGNVEEAGNGLRLFMKNVHSQTGLHLVIQNALVKLLGSVHEALLKSGVDMIELYEGSNLYQDLMGLNETDEKVEWFEQKVFAPFLTAVHSSQELQMQNVIQKVIQYLEQHYTKDLTFECIADEYGVSMTKLSRAFKSVTGCTYTDYLTRLRLEKCKELLMTTDMKVNDIAELLRYQPAYLIRIFKKAEQMTPGQYREQHSSSAAGGLK